MACGACKQPCKGKSCSEGGTFITCTKCFSDYHTLCLNMSREDIKSYKSKNQFSCPECKLKTKSLISDQTPVKPKQQDLPVQVDDSFMTATQKLSKIEIPAVAMTSFTAAINELRDIFVSMKKEMTEFTTCLNSSSDEILSFRKELADLQNHMKETEKYKSEVISLRAEVAELRQSISTKEQRRLLKDVEISGLPENKSENVNQLVSVISSKLGVDLDPRDVDDVKRVGARGDDAAQHPRPVVLTLTRRPPRDQLLRAARVRHGLSTDMIQVPGSPRRVYLNEHLTKDNRVLFSKTRKLGSELRFKFVWSSNGNIFMRRSETSSVLQVRSEAILDKLKAQNCSSVQIPNEPYCS